MLLVAFVACNPATQVPSLRYLPVPAVTPGRPVQPVEDYDTIIGRNHPQQCGGCKHPNLYTVLGN